MRTAEQMSSVESTTATGPCFAFNSHMDTVPAGGGWSSDPFRLAERDGKLFGRGACDAKGPIVAMAEAGRLLASQRDQWRGTLVLMFVADEEINGGGSRALATQRPRPDWIVIGEPTNNAVFVAHKGCLRPLVRAKGQGRAFRPPGAWRQCNPRREPAHVPV